MPARFINVSGNGRARFINVSGNGGAFFGSGSISTGTTTTTTTVATLTFSVSASNSQCVPDGTATVYVVRTSNNDATLSAASSNSSALYRMPQNILVTGFNYVKDISPGTVYLLNSTTAVVGSVDTNC